MIGETDYQRSKLLDLWANKNADGDITEEEFEKQADRLHVMSPSEVTIEYRKRFRV